MAQVAAAAAAALSRVKKVRPGCVICTPSTRVNRILVLGQLISVLISCTSILTQILNQNFQVQ
jgi:anti-anti-sigma regulatory factor